MHVERIHRPVVVQMNSDDNAELDTPGFGWIIFAESESESRDLWNFIAQFYEDEPKGL